MEQEEITVVRDDDLEVAVREFYTRVKASYEKVTRENNIDADYVTTVLHTMFSQIMSALVEDGNRITRENFLYVAALINEEFEPPQNGH